MVHQIQTSNFAQHVGSEPDGCGRYLKNRQKLFTYEKRYNFPDDPDTFADLQFICSKTCK